MGVPWSRYGTARVQGGKSQGEEIDQIGQRGPEKARKTMSKIGANIFKLNE
jgi:hypothetical protein